MQLVHGDPEIKKPNTKAKTVDLHLLSLCWSEWLKALMMWLITKYMKIYCSASTVTALTSVGQKKKQATFPQASHFDCKLKTTSTTFF